MTALISALLIAVALAAVPAATSAASSPGCAWGLQVGNGGVDGYGADLNASYWLTSMLATPGAGLIISGTFPHARYMSISAYTPGGPVTGTHLYDAEIQPATGANPFQSDQPADAAGTYTIRILAQPTPADPAPNTLYVGNNSQLVSIIYRLYDPESAADPTGGAGLPTVATTFAGIVTQTLSGCVTDASAAHAVLASTAATPPGTPTWQPVEISSLPNSDASYLESQIAPPAGSVAVIRMRTPTFPNTNSGDPPWAPEQVRYWSLCDYSVYQLTAYGCVADYQAVQDAGTATFVISTPVDQPANATAANGVNWLPWGDPAFGIVVYRQILAASTFGGAIGAIPPGVAASTAMGSYYPDIQYCTVAEFEAAGAAGCLTPPPATVSSPPAGPSNAAPTVSGPTRSSIAALLDREIAPAGKAARIANLVRARGYTFDRFRLPEGGAVTLQWSYRAKSGRIVLASGSLRATAATTARLRVRLAPPARTLLAHAKRISLQGTARFAPAIGETIAAARSFTLSGGPKARA
jgi:hypothetical protein